MKTIFALIFALGLSFSVYADDFVIVSGTGKNETEARNSAFIAAVEQAVGVMVSSEILIKDGKLINDKIYTRSQGFIEKYDIVSTQQNDKGYSVTIKAIVSKGNLAKEIEIVTGHKIDIDGKNLGAKLVTQKKNFDDTLKIAPDELEKIKKRLHNSFKLEIQDIKFDYKTSKKVPYIVDVSAYFDYDEYNNAIDELNEIFLSLGAKTTKGIASKSITNFTRNRQSLLLNKVILGKGAYDHTEYIATEYVFDDVSWAIIQRFLSSFKADFNNNINLNFLNQDTVIISQILKIDYKKGNVVALQIGIRNMGYGFPYKGKGFTRVLYNNQGIMPVIIGGSDFSSVAFNLFGEIEPSLLEQMTSVAIEMK
jgi:hypothetical protein